MTDQFLRSIAYRWHLGMDTLEIAQLLNMRECDVYNRLPEARRMYPPQAFRLLHPIYAGRQS